MACGAFAKAFVGSLFSEVNDASGSRMVTNSSAIVGWMPIVRSKSMKVYIIATAKPWTSSSAMANHMASEHVVGGAIDNHFE
ncbi:MAG: hypothetical protein R3A47_11155 [Polyangiales bacterium]